MGDKVSYKFCSGDEMNAVAVEMRTLVLASSVPVEPGETVKAQMRRGWGALGKPAWWRFKAAWYGEAGGWSAVAVDDFRSRDARRRNKEAKVRDNANAAIAALRALRDRYAEADPDFHREQILAIEHALQQAGDEPNSLGLGDSALDAPGSR